MKASEVLRRYKEGERHFRHLNLRGQSFVGKDLSGADFSECDIQSANFTGAILRGTSFRGAKAGLQRRWATLLLIISWLLSGISGIFSAFAGVMVSLIFDKSSIQSQVAGWTVLVVLVLFFFVTIRRGIGSGLVAGAVALALAGAVAGALIMFYGYITWQALKENEKYILIRNVAIAFAAIGGTSFRGADLTDADFTEAKLKSTDLRKAVLTRTCWRHAQKLDRVRPGNSYLNNTQVRQLVVTGQGKGKRFERLSYLQGINLKEAYLTDASFAGSDLREASLEKAILTDANLSGAILNAARLQDADLSRAKLVQAQLDEADLTGANLTGAYIEDWGITSHTKLDGVRCQYIFMRLPTKEDPNPRRKPDNHKEEFADGDFADFIKPIVDTLDLYHNQDVDPRAIAISFKQLAEKHPDAQLEIVSVEKRGQDKVLLRAGTAPNADRSRLSDEYFDDYNRIKALTEQEVTKALLAEKDSRIAGLQTMLETALKSPNFYTETYYKKVDTMSEDKSIHISAGGSVGAVGGGDVDVQGVINLGTISGNVTNAIDELPSSDDSNKPGIKELLAQLQDAISNSDLEQEDKAEALEQVKTLAEAGKNPQDNAMKKIAKTAVKILRGTVTALPEATKLVEQFNKLLPAIASFFGLA